MVQEIAIRVRLQEHERIGLAEYERLVGAVATVAAVIAWLPTPDARLVLRGRSAEPVRLETVSHGSTAEMLLVLDQRSAAVERAAAAVAALVEAVRQERVDEDPAGVAGELDRLDRAAPRGRSVVERSLRAFLEGARADVLARRSTTRVRAAQALVRLAEDGASIVVERVDDALAPEVVEQPVGTLQDTGGTVVVPERQDDGTTEQSKQQDDGGEQRSKQQDDGATKLSKKDGKKKDGKKKDDEKKAGKKKAGKKKKKSKKKDDEKKKSKKKK